MFVSIGDTNFPFKKEDCIYGLNSYYNLKKFIFHDFVKYFNTEWNVSK